MCSWYSVSVCADGYASEIEKDVEIDGLYQHFFMAVAKMPARSISLKLPGLCNVSNAAAALSAFCLLTSDEQYDSYQLDFSTFSVRGRFEMVGHFQGGTIMIDYAHNEASLKNLLESLRAYHPNRILCMFGCGGNRSAVRRSAMGRVSSELADLTIITQDNSRDEPFEQIFS